MSLALSAPLDAGALRDALSAAARAELDALHVLPEIDSTNAEALRHPPPPRGTRAWLAEHQTAGRGRRGRTWATPPGSQVALSLSRRFPPDPAALQGLSLAVGVAAAEALHGLGFSGVGLKWPNDLLADGRKLGGILVELRTPADGALHVVVGLGVNTCLPATAGEAIDQPWCDLAGLSATPVSRHAVCVALLDALLPMLARFESEGLAPWRDGWRRHDLLAGRAVRLDAGSGVLEGIALGIDDEGALRLRTADGERRCHAGEASLRAA